MEVLNYFTLSEILELQDISEDEVLQLLIKEGLIDLDIYTFVEETSSGDYYGEN